MPPYNGDLFSSDPGVNKAGGALADLALTNAEFGRAVAALLVDADEEAVAGPVDFRSLSVREFGCGWSAVPAGTANAEGRSSL